MEASTGFYPLPISHSIDPLTHNIKQRLIKKGVSPTPKIIHTVRKKELQKSLRKAKRLASKSPPQPITPSDEFYFQNICKEYRDFTKALDSSSNGSVLVGKPWESLGREKMRELGSGFDGKELNVGGKLQFEPLRELGLILNDRKVETLSSFLDDDVELEEGLLEGERGPIRRRVSDSEAIRILVDRLSAREITAKDWKFTRMMKQSGLRFTEDQLLKIVGGLGDCGCWKQAMEVVGWVYNKKEHSHYKSRFVFTKLLAVLGKASRPKEALQIFKQMRGDCHIYPDMAAYHSISVTLGQAGMVRELMSVIECMKEKPSKTIKNMIRKNWDPTLQPDIVVFNSVLNSCIQSRQWKGVSWVFEQLRKGGLKANSASYGLAMEVMLNSEKYDLVHELFLKMKRNGVSLKALTYKVLVRAFWKEGKVDEAVHIVRDMEQKGIIGSASVYYELACCLCNKGRWKEAMVEIEQLKNLRHSKPLAVAFTGMILSSLDGGNVNDCVSLFEHMHNHCVPNIGTVNAMLKVYGRNDMFLEAEELFENVKRSHTGYSTCFGDGDPPLIPDMYTYGLMLEASARAQQWEYLEYVYKEMCLSGFQLDQGKHAVLLVEASKAGKWLLLEHAFNTSLESGEIPHQMLFSEMIIQATLLGDYEKAATIVCAMVHTPFQLSAKDWTDHFEKNKDRITDEHLKKLLYTLRNRQMAEGTSASELLKALHSISGDELSIASYSHSDNGDWDPIVVDSSGDNTLQDNNFDGDELPLDRPNDEKGDPLAFSSNCDNDEDDTYNPSKNLSSFVYDESFTKFSDEPSHAGFHFPNAFEREQTPDDEDSVVNDCDDDEPVLPSADEILQFWKQKDGFKFCR